jgi:hypothetical protein
MSTNQELIDLVSYNFVLAWMSNSDEYQQISSTERCGYLQSMRRCTTPFVDSPCRAHIGGYEMKNLTSQEIGSLISGITGMMTSRDEVLSNKFTRDEHDVLFP